MRKPMHTITQVDFYRTLRERQEFFERVMRPVQPTFFERHLWLKRKRPASRNGCPTIANEIIQNPINPV